MKILRNQNQINFTTVDNYFIKDKTLSTKAKGFLIQLLALPDQWDFSKGGLESIIKEGSRVVDSCLAELKDHGYVTIDKYKNAETGKFEYEYRVYAIPYYCEFTPDGNIINKKTGVVGRGEKYIQKDSLLDDYEFKLENYIVSYLEDNTYFKGSVEFFKKGLPVQLKLHNRTITKVLRSISKKLVDDDGIKLEIIRRKSGLEIQFSLIKDYEIIFQNNSVRKVNQDLCSSLHSPTIRDEYIANKGVNEPDPHFVGVAHTPMKSSKSNGVNEPDPHFVSVVHTPENRQMNEPDPHYPDVENVGLYKRMNNKEIDIRLIEKAINNQFQVDELLASKTVDVDKELITEMLQVIEDVMCCQNQSVRMGNDIYPTEKVKERFSHLNKNHLEYVLDCVKRQKHQIKNINAYLMKSLFNAQKSFNFKKWNDKHGVGLPAWYADTASNVADDETLLKAYKQQLELISENDEENKKRIEEQIAELEVKINNRENLLISLQDLQKQHSKQNRH